MKKVYEIWQEYWWNYIHFLYYFIIIIGEKIFILLRQYFFHFFCPLWQFTIKLDYNQKILFVSPNRLLTTIFLEFSVRQHFFWQAAPYLQVAKPKKKQRTKQKRRKLAEGKYPKKRIKKRLQQRLLQLWQPHRRPQHLPRFQRNQKIFPRNKEPDLVRCPLYWLVSTYFYIFPIVHYFIHIHTTYLQWNSTSLCR